MAATTSEYKVRIVADTRDFEQKLDELERRVEALTQSFARLQEVILNGEVEE